MLQKMICVTISLALTMSYGTELSVAENLETNNVFTGRPVEMVVSSRLEGANFFIYEPPLKVKGRYKTIDEAHCLTLEALVESIQSAVTQEWVDYNEFPGKSHVVTEKQFEFRRKSDREKNYLELIHKLSFQYNGLETAIVKYRFVDDGESTMLASMVVQKKDGRWFRTSIAGIDHLSAVVKRAKPKVLDSLLMLNLPEGNESIQELDGRVRTDIGILDSEKLYCEMMKLRSEEKWDDFFIWNDK